MSKRLIHTFLLSSLVAFSPLSPAASTSGVSAALESVVNKHDGFSGVVLVARGNKALLSQGWGDANREWSVPNDSMTKFRLGSLSKPFTALLVLRLVQEGKISLDAPISRYLPELPARTADKVCVRDLLSHTSGLQEFYRIPQFERLWLYEPPSTHELIHAVFENPLEFEPARQYAYRNIGYMTLTAITEAVTGASYETNLHEYILGPARMADTGVEQDGEVIARRAEGYARDDENWVRGSYLNMNLPGGAGSIFSTAEDLLRFSRALDESLFLDQDLHDEMFKPRIKEKDDPASERYYAFGWHLDTLEVSSGIRVKIIEHGGDVTSFETLMTRVPELDAVIVILYNHGETDQDSLRDNLIRVLIKAQKD